jgi:oligoribonuclease NrnB/cAMP/cGMP phosphodiesterase (DHH superfamily)
MNGPIENNGFGSENPPVCIWHKGCMDGFTSAWVVRNYFDRVDFHAGVYQQEPPWELIADRDVMMVDFSYKRPVIEKIAAHARSVLILDHHSTAEADLMPFARPWRAALQPQFPKKGECVAFFDMGRSGATLTHDFLYEGLPRPMLVEYAEDRDLWKFEIEGTREITALLYSHDMTFDTWDRYGRMLETEEGRVAARAEGAALLRQHMRTCRQLVAECTREFLFKAPDGMFHTVPTVNAPWMYSSDVGNILAGASKSKIGATYYDREDGRRVFSLRSTKDGPDVSEIAKIYGGGGHRNAAGFTEVHNYEGEIDLRRYKTKHDGEGKWL